MAEKYDPNWSALERGLHKYNLPYASQYIAEGARNIFGSVKLFVGDFYINYLENSPRSSDNNTLPDIEDSMYRDVRIVLALGTAVTATGIVVQPYV